MSRRIRITRALTIVLACVVFAASLMPTPAAASGINDKLLHIAAFAGLMLPTAAASPRDAPIAAAGLLLLGASIEFLQPSFGRTADFRDFAADVVGVMAGLFLGLLLRCGWKFLHNAR